MPVVNTSTILNTNTTLMAVLLDTVSKGLVLGSNIATNIPTQGRIVYIKAAAPDNHPAAGELFISCSTGVTIYPGLETRMLNPYYCVTLLENPTNTYNLINYYNNNLFGNFVPPDPASVAVSISPTNSFVFVDLLTQSKTVLLPPVDSTVSTNESAPYFLIRDTYGNANVNSLYISTTGGATIDGIGNSLQLQLNYCVVELAGDKNLNRWHILNNYQGTL